MDQIIDTFFNIDVLIRTHKFLLYGIGTSLRLIALSVTIAMLWGLLLSVLRNVNFRFINYLIIAYIDMLRALPILVTMLLLYYALPFVGISMSSFWAATLALSMTGGAYYAEIFRSGIEIIPIGQTEAARSMGLSYIQTMYSVILPQAIRVVLPPLTTNTLEFLKSTAVASVVALPEILNEAIQAQSLTFNPTPLIAALLFYLCLCYPLVLLIEHLEKPSTIGMIK
jgi:polar amino acid transport system permease protein